MRYLSIVLLLFFAMCQPTSEVKRFDIPELGFSFEEPKWYGIQNKKFTDTLNKYNWNVRTAITESTNFGSIEIMRYHKDSINKDEKEFLKISVGGLHVSLQDFDKFLAFTQDIKYRIPDLKVIQPITEINVSGKRAITKFLSYSESDTTRLSHKLFTKSVSIFMGNHLYNIYIQTKDKEDIEVFDNLVKTIAITK